MYTDSFSVDGQSITVAGRGPTQYILGSDGLPNFNEDESIVNMEDTMRSLNKGTLAESGFFAETWSSKLTEVFDKYAILKEEMDKATTTTTFPDSSTGDEFKTITRVMQTAGVRNAKRDIFYVSTGGEA